MTGKKCKKCGKIHQEPSYEIHRGVNPTRDMIDHANFLAPNLQMNRTIENDQQTVNGLIGEMIFTEWFFNDWKTRFTLKKIKENFGHVDIDDKIEIKTSAFPYGSHLHLPIRHDYGEKRIPDCYVFVNINIPEPQDKKCTQNTEVIIVGWIEGKNSHIKKGNLTSRYETFLVPIHELKPMVDFPST